MFTLKICLSLPALNALKDYLRDSLPHVKSSHRCEAIGRGFGFKTYASARISAQSAAPPELEVDGSAFAAYLQRNGFFVSSVVFYRAAAKFALSSIAESHPILTVWGVGSGQPRRTATGRFENVSESVAKFRSDRASLVSEHSVEPFLAALALVSQIPKTKTIRSGIGSYTVKHIAEKYPCRYPGGEPLGPTYVPNGVLIAAAIHAGFRYKTYIDERGYNAINVSFNMPQSRLADLDCEFRPDGGRAQDRKFRQKARSATFGLRP